MSRLLPLARRAGLSATALAVLMIAATPVLAGPKHGHGGHGDGHGKHAYAGHGWEGKGHAYGHDKKHKKGYGRVLVPVAAVAATAVAVPVVANVVTAPATVVTAPTTVVYPPWIVAQSQGPVYRSGYEPAPPARRDSVFRCNSKVIGQVVGGVAGAAIGHQVGDGQALATVGGAIVGVLVGGEIGRQIDAHNQACIGQALEFSPQGKRIQWVGGPSNLQYAVVPGPIERRGSGEYCRRYEAEVLTGSGWQKLPGLACRQADGVWIAGR